MHTSAKEMLGAMRHMRTRRCKRQPCADRRKRRSQNSSLLMQRTLHLPHTSLLEICDFSLSASGVGLSERRKHICVCSCIQGIRV